MEPKDFKRLFSSIATENGFTAVFGGWCTESTECIVVLDLQKSNYGNYFELNIKVFIQGIFDKTYSMNKRLVKSEVAGVFVRPPVQFRDALDLDVMMKDAEREEKLRLLLINYCAPLALRARSRAGLMELFSEGKVFIPPAVQRELRRLR